uniref:F-box/LRR-repeat protein 4-like isoform X2 n=1 Tax=Myxine glutinosa TaxID=7769 RepID=UPI00358DFDDA
MLSVLCALHFLFNRTRRNEGILKERPGHAPGPQEEEADVLIARRSLPELSQYAVQVLDLSSQYGGDDSISYTMHNLAGPPNIYPLAGDFTHAALLRTYGTWWDHLARWTPERCPKNPDWFQSRDFVELLFDEPVFPTGVSVLETDHPGYVVRILARSWDEGEQSGVHMDRWRTLWSGPVETDLPPNDPRKLCPSIHPPGFATNLLRLEFNCSMSVYYMELDAVILHGVPVDIRQPKRRKSREELDDSERLRKKQNGFERSRRNEEEGKLYNFTKNGYFDLLPYELIEIILSFLTLPELCRLAQCSRTLRDYCYDPFMYKHLDLKPFWPSLCEEDLLALKPRLTHTRSLGLSWTGNKGSFSPTVLDNFLGGWSEHLLQLELANCHWITNESLETVTMLCPNLQDLDLSSCDQIPPGEFKRLSSLQRLRRLVLYRTRINTESLLSIISKCTQLRHLNLGGCLEVKEPDVVLVVLASNCQQLRSLDMWRSSELTEIGLAHLASRCKNIEDLDLGWCGQVQAGVGVVVVMARGLPRLRRLVLTANRSVSDTDLESLANCCPLLEQLDILGTPLVTPGGIFNLLYTCQYMRLLDISFCSQVDEAMADQLANSFPHVSIKHSDGP